MNLNSHLCLRVGGVLRFHDQTFNQVAHFVLNRLGQSAELGVLQSIQIIIFLYNYVGNNCVPGLKSAESRSSLSSSRRRNRRSPGRGRCPAWRSPAPRRPSWRTRPRGTLVGHQNIFFKKIKFEKNLAEPSSRDTNLTKNTIVVVFRAKTQWFNSFWTNKIDFQFEFIFHLPG